MISERDLNSLYFYRVNDDSMKGARIRKGSTVIVNKQGEVNSGEVALVAFEGGAIIRRVYQHEGQAILKSENPKYPPLALKGRANILGKVIECRTPIECLID